MNTNAQNAFLTPVVESACNDARICYMDVLVRQCYYRQPVDWLERMSHQSRNNLDTLKQTALEAAAAGNIQDGITLLAGILREWGSYVAFKDLVDADAHGVDLDPTDPVVYADLQQDFQRDIDNKVVVLATELTNAWLAGRTQREQAGHSELIQDYSSLQHINLEVIQRQGSALQQAHQANQQYADTALRGVKQAQQGVYWMQEGVYQMYQFVQGHGANMVGGMQALRHQLEENLPSAVEEASRRRSTRQLVGLLVTGLIIAGLIGLAILIGTNLVGH